MSNNQDGVCPIHHQPYLNRQCFICALAAKKIARAMEDRDSNRLLGRLRRAIEVLKSAPCACDRQSDGWPCDRCVSLHELQQEIP